MKRGVGYSHFINRNKEGERFEELSQQLSTQTRDQYLEILKEFRENFENFIKKYRNLIDKDPEFKLKFLEICNILSIDPLSIRKSYWKFGNLISEISTLILEICINTRNENGGIFEANTILEMVPKCYNLSLNDILRVARELEVFGKNSLKVVKVNHKHFIVTNLDFSENLEKCLEVASELNRGITSSDLSIKLGWTLEKSQIVLSQLISTQVIWIDCVPGLFVIFIIFRERVRRSLLLVSFFDLYFGEWVAYLFIF